MDITISSYLSSAVSITVLVGVLLLILKKQSIMYRFGLGCIYFLVLLLLLRGFLPIEFYEIHLTHSIYSYKIIPWFKDFFRQEIITWSSASITGFHVLFLVYGIGVLVQLHRIFRGYYFSGKYISSLPDIKDIRITRILHTAHTAIYHDKECRFRVVSSEKFTTPAIGGIFRPTIILPLYEYSEKEYYYIFLHEILHYKRKDFICKLLLDILMAFYWWNPLLSRLLFPVINQIQELFVDYHLTKSLDSGEKANYMMVLTKTLRFQKKAAEKPWKETKTYALMDSHSDNNIIQRLQYIMKHSVKQVSIVGIIVCICMFFSSYLIVFEPAYRVTQDENGERVYEDIEGQTYYVRNGAEYDLYLENEYVGTYPFIHEPFKDAPIYDNLEEVHINEK